MESIGVAAGIETEGPWAERCAGRESPQGSAFTTRPRSYGDQCEENAPELKSNANEVTSVCPRNVGRIQSWRSFTRPTNGAVPTELPPCLEDTSLVTPRRTSEKTNFVAAASSSFFMSPG